MSEEKSRGQLMQEYNARVAAVRAGLSQAQVKALLGVPNAELQRGEVESPTSVFQSLGLNVNFGDDANELVWAYVDPYRPRVAYYIGFRDGKVVSHWKERVSTAASSA